MTAEAVDKPGISDGRETHTAQGGLADNQRHLAQALSKVRASIEEYVGKIRGIPPAETVEAPDRSHDFSFDDKAGSPLETLCAIFRLSPFERDILLLCAGIELDSTFAQLCGVAQGDSQRNYPTFSLALAALPNPHWSALTPAAPLRRWKLVEIGPFSTLTTSPLRVDERVLHYLVGLQYFDERFAGIIEPMRGLGDLTDSQRIIAKRLVAAWLPGGAWPLPILQLCGDETGAREIAAAVCGELGLGLATISGNSVPTSGAELEVLIRLWQREAVLSTAALFLDCHQCDGTDPIRERAISRLIDSIGSALIVSERERRRSDRVPMITFEVGKPTADEKSAIWREAGGTAVEGLDGELDSIVSQFNLSVPSIRGICAQALRERNSDDQPNVSGNLQRTLWDACKIEARSPFQDLAQRLDTVAKWDDLVLPKPQREILREIAAHVRHRSKVYERWGFASKSSRGLGISALFVGSSGTGKTMAAEVLANELNLDLYRIDLSQVVSKYIGETEKNLRKVFEAAEEGGAILLFDEADALFGKRSEVKDSHDRYANIEVSYLLQRMESYSGLAILTTNMREALDAAFLRRLRFIVNFPFPDATLRAEIWRRIFPPSTPTADLDIDRLSRLNVSGGSIRNIALNAAFLAADLGEPIKMKHLLHAARSEFTKLEKPLTGSEIGGWI